MSHSQAITIREIKAYDLDTIYRQQLDSEANWMAAFVGKDPTDRAAFDAHWRKIIGVPAITNRTILVDGQIAGHIACFPESGHLEVTYWLGREFWGRGIATRALELLMQLIVERPVYGRTAQDNIGSLRVLQKCGFKIIGQDKGFAHGRGGETEEYILRLDSAS